jgi:hypothetical protein
VGVRDCWAIRWMGRTCSGCGSGARQTLIGGETPVEIDHQTHYWALRQQARHLFALSLGEPGVIAPPVGVGLVVAPLWWWGVVFDLWIVVASI